MSVNMEVVGDGVSHRDEPLCSLSSFSNCLLLTNQVFSPWQAWELPHTLLNTTIQSPQDVDKTMFLFQVSMVIRWCRHLTYLGLWQPSYRTSPIAHLVRYVALSHWQFIDSGGGNSKIDGLSTSLIGRLATTHALLGLCYTYQADSMSYWKVA